MQGAKIGFLPQGDMLSYSAPDAELDRLTVLQAVLAADSEMARAVQARAHWPAVSRPCSVVCCP
jgi:hypothetical protein